MCVKVLHACVCSIQRPKIWCNAELLFILFLRQKFLLNLKHPCVLGRQAKAQGNIHFPFSQMLDLYMHSTKTSFNIVGKMQTQVIGLLHQVLYPQNYLHSLYLIYFQSHFNWEIKKWVLSFRSAFKASTRLDCHWGSWCVSSWEM